MNGLTTRWEIDTLGRRTREIHADGTRLVTAYCYIAGRIDTASTSPTSPSPGAAEIPADAVRGKPLRDYENHIKATSDRTFMNGRMAARVPGARLFTMAEAGRLK